MLSIASSASSAAVSSRASRASFRLLSLFAGVALALTGCGGGGGGSPEPPPPPPAPKLVFAPTSIQSSPAYGESQTLNVNASVTDDVSTSAYYIGVVQDGDTFTDSDLITPSDSNHFTITLYTSPSASLGEHRGTLSVHLCRDEQCQQPLAGSPFSLPYDVVVSRSPITLSTGVPSWTSEWNGPAHPFDVTVFSGGADWVVASSADWLKPRVAGGTTTDNRLTVDVIPGDLPVGTYGATLTVSGSDGQQSARMGYTLTVNPAKFVLDNGHPVFTAVNGAAIAPQVLALSLDDQAAGSWTLTNDAPWLGVSATSGSTPGTITLSPDPSIGALATGIHDAHLSFASLVADTLAVSPRLTLLAPQLSASSTSIVLGGPRGRDLATAGSLSLSLNTGDQAWAWTATGVPAWLSMPASGTVDASGTAFAPALRVDQLAPGSVTSNVRIAAPINGDTPTASVAVTANVDRHRLLASAWGVGLAATPTGTVTRRTISISDNFGASTDWTASSDSTWLTVTSSGRTGGSSSLQLVADPSAAPDGLSIATVTVAPSTAAGVSGASIRVGLWKAATGLATTIKQAGAWSHLAVDATRPYVYASSGGPSIRVFNAYTANTVATIDAGTSIGEMAVSPDGKRLFAVDASNRLLRVVDLDTLSVVASWSLKTAATLSTHVTVARTNGEDIVFVGNGDAIHEGIAVRSNVGSGSTQVVASPDGAHVATISNEYSTSAPSLYGADWSAMGGGTLFAAYGTSGKTGSGGVDVAFSPDGTRIYSASAMPGSCEQYDGSLAYLGVIPGGDSYPNNVEVTSDGRMICGIQGWYSSADFWVHDANGVVTGTFKVAGYAKGLLKTELVVTPDGFVVVVPTDDPLLAFVPIGP